MIFLFFVFLFLILLFFIGFIRIKILFDLNDSRFFRICLKILFFRFVLFSNFECDDKLNFEESKIKKKRENLKKIKKKKRESKKSDKKKLLFLEKFNLFFVLFEPTVNFLKFLNRGLVIKNFKLYFNLAGEDACRTAIFYGNFCGWFYSFFKIFRSIFNVEVDCLKIVPNFVVEKSKYNLNFCMQLRLGRLLIGLLKYILTIIVKVYLFKLNKDKIKT